MSKGGTSRIRFIMLDAELPEGDLSQITSAIQNALQPTTIIQQRLPNQPVAPALMTNGAAGDPIDEEPSELAGCGNKAVARLICAFRNVE